MGSGAQTTGAMAGLSLLLLLLGTLHLAQSRPQFGEDPISASIIGGALLYEELRLVSGVAEGAAEAAEAAEAGETAEAGVQTVPRTYGYGSRCFRFCGRNAAGGIIGSGATTVVVGAGCYLRSGSVVCSQ